MTADREREERRMTFIVVPHGGGDLSTRSFELSYRQLRVAAIAGLVLASLLLLMAVSWVWVAAGAARAAVLEREVEALQKDRLRLEQLARILTRLEAQNEQMRRMLGGGIDRDSIAADSAAVPRDSAPGDVSAAPAGPSPLASLPRAWPLRVQAAFVTRGQGGGGHPGVDIAVAHGSAIRASGAGTVVEAGEDPVYGRFVRISHGGGYESLYGHASRVLVRARQRVGADQVIALSGSTGVSTAPHLHFEIRKDGTPVDPGTLVRHPSLERHGDL
jgi:murein DD-endopeptidase MepM/ murein hydrolase activator NlpD